MRVVGALLGCLRLRVSTSFPPETSPSVPRTRCFQNNGVPSGSNAAVTHRHIYRKLQHDMTVGVFPGFLQALAAYLLGGFVVCGRLSGWARVATKGVRALCGGRRLHGLDHLSVGEGGCSPSQSRELTCENPARCHSAEWDRSGSGGRGDWSHQQACGDAVREPCAPSSSSLT